MEDTNIPSLRETNSIKVSRGMKGIYGWEIKIIGDDEKDILERIKNADAELVKTYAQLNTTEVK